MIFISPIISLFYLIKNVDWRGRKPFLILLTIIFGATIILQSSDGAVLKEMVYVHYIDLPFRQWFSELLEILQFRQPHGTKGDVFNHVISYLSGTVLSMPESYFIIVSCVYAYFFINSIQKILDREFLGEKNILFWFVLIIFITYRFVDNLQTVRTWNGLWILFYGTYCYYETKKIKYLFLMLMAPLFHVAYFVMALPVYMGIVLRKVNPLILIAVYVSSFFITINQAAIVEQLSSTDIGASKVNAYYDEDGSTSIGAKEVSGNFYVKWGKNWSQKQSPHIFLAMLILTGFYSKKRLTEVEYGLFCSALLLATVANLGAFIGAFYSRTITNAGIYVVAVAAMLMIRGAFDTKRGYISLMQRNILWAASLSFVPYLVYVLANMLQFTSAFMIFFPVWDFFEDAEIAFIDLFKYFL